jgi:hypothetical protein
LPKGCQRFAKGLPKVCQRVAKGLPKGRVAKGLPQGCQRVRRYRTWGVPRLKRKVFWGPAECTMRRYQGSGPSRYKNIKVFGVRPSAQSDAIEDPGPRCAKTQNLLAFSGSPRGAAKNWAAFPLVLLLEAEGHETVSPGAAKSCSISACFTTRSGLSRNRLPGAPRKIGQHFPLFYYSKRTVTKWSPTGAATNPAAFPLAQYWRRRSWRLAGTGPARRLLIHTAGFG